MKSVNSTSNSSADREQLPTWKTDGLSFKLIAGSALGHTSPVPVYSPLYFLEIKSSERKTIKIGHELYGESAIYILEGSLESDGVVHEPKRILVAKDSTLCEFTLDAGTTIYLFGGEPFPEERLIFWNFVATSEDLLEDAKKRWAEQTFPKIEGEIGYVPLPS